MHQDTMDKKADESFTGLNELADPLGLYPRGRRISRQRAIREGYDESNVFGNTRCIKNHSKVVSFLMSQEILHGPENGGGRGRIVAHR